MQDGRLPPLAPLTARSVMLNVLLGVHPPELPVSALVRIGTLFGVAEGTTRVALTRMTADGDVVGDNGTYRLSERLTRRQAVLDEVRWPATKAWDGTWEMTVVRAGSRAQSDRMALRKFMTECRMGELREGVWLRPDNLRRPLDLAADQCQLFTTSPSTPLVLAESLWDLSGWAAEARRLRARLDEPDLGLVESFMLASEAMRHLLIDPRLPEELQPPGWPAEDFHRRYVDFDAEVAERIRRFHTAG